MEITPAHLLRQVGKTILDMVFPPGCLRCGEPLDTPGQLCAACWPEMAFISAPFCEICGYPFEYDAGAGALCAACIRRPPPYSRARAVLQYDDASRSMILGYKHSDQTDRAPAFAGWMVRAGEQLLRDCDIICAVPLHRTRLIRRRFNQSALLALEIAKRSRRPALPDLLLRTRATPSQGGLSARGRQRNVSGAFAVNPARAAAIKGRRVLLIDDVLTTGATVNGCARALLAGGAADVMVLTLSRVVRPANPAI